MKKLKSSLTEFREEDFRFIYKIGYLSNDASYILNSIKLEVKPMKNLDSLKNLLKMLKNYENGKKSINQFRYTGNESKEISTYNNIMKILLRFSRNESYNEIQNRIESAKNNIEIILEKIENSQNLKVEMNRINEILEFLSFISKCYLNINHKYMHHK